MNGLSAWMETVTAHLTMLKWAVGIEFVAILVLFAIGGILLVMGRNSKQ